MIKLSQNLPIIFCRIFFVDFLDRVARKMVWKMLKKWVKYPVHLLIFTKVFTVLTMVVYSIFAKCDINQKHILVVTGFTHAQPRADTNHVYITGLYKMMYGNLKYCNELIFKHTLTRTGL